MVDPTYDIFIMNAEGWTHQIIPGIVMMKRAAKQ